MRSGGLKIAKRHDKNLDGQTLPVHLKKPQERGEESSKLAISNFFFLRCDSPQRVARGKKNQLLNKNRLQQSPGGYSSLAALTCSSNCLRRDEL